MIGTAGHLVHVVQTPKGPGRWHVDAGPAVQALLLLGHGAGGGVDAPDLALLARRLPENGIAVARFEQPWRTAGRRVAGPPPTLDEAWLAAAAWLRDQPWAQVPWVVGGRSAGARVACRTAEALRGPALALEGSPSDGASVGRPVGVLCLAFPLHLPGRPDRSRVAELVAPTLPRLVLQGSRDTFGSARDLRAAIAQEVAGEVPRGTRGAAGLIEVVELPGADHGFRLPAGSPVTPATQRERIVAEVRDFVARLTAYGDRDGLADRQGNTGDGGRR